MVLDSDLLIKPRSSGIVIPPADIKKLADKAAEYVAKNGSVFEDQLLQKELNNPKFCFLKRDDPYRAYYEHKITDYARGLVDQNEPDFQDTQKNTLSDIQVKKMSMKTPSGYSFIGEQREQPHIIKHTAAFAAKNGKKFLASLTEREKQNPQFDFLKPTSDLFQFFTSMLDAYTKCLQPKREDIDKLMNFVQDKNFIYQRCLERFEYESYQNNEKEKQQQLDDEEKQQMAMIDWNDFAVVEQIDFYEEDKHEKVIEKGTQRFDKIDFATLEPSISVQSQVSSLINQPEVRLLNQPTSYTLASTQPKKEAEQATVTENVQIIKGYVRPSNNQEQVMIKCEICNKNFPKTQINDHIQIELQDPKYMEIKQEMQNLEKSSTMPQGDMIAKHLNQLKKKRPDIFHQEQLPPLPSQPPPPPPKK